MKSTKAVFIAMLMFCSSLMPHTIFADNEPYPLEYFALREVINNVSISPDGKKLSLLKIPNKDGDPILEIYDANDLSKAPFRVNADPMEITRAGWVSNGSMILNLRQKVRDKIDGFNRGVYAGALARLDVNTREIKKFQFEGQSPSIESQLIDEPNKILVSFDEDGKFFSPREYYVLDLLTGRKRLALKGTVRVPVVSFDSFGNPIFGRSFERATGMNKWFVRKPGSKKWQQIYSLHEDSFESFRIEAFDSQNSNILFVSANNGRDTIGLWEFDITTNKFGELIYARKDVNVAGVRYHSNSWEHPDTVVGVGYRTDKTHVEYFDEIEAATFKQLEELIPSAHGVRIIDRSKDGNTLVIYNAGPRDPGTYYLLKNGALKTIGSKQPLLESDKLADVKYISWKARDGKKIRGYITIPNSEPPYPLIVLPHGGPFVSEVVAYDEWGQMLANNGYMVLQPQYRGSTNFGIDFYTSAFIKGGQGGFKMQDDKDDGAMHLVKQGLVDKDRIAMFGWSYGGYAALVAASRDDQIHQCVIAGAAVSDPLMQVNYYRNRGLRGSAKTEQVNMWIDSISPIKEVEKVNVPVYLIHGSVDQRVPPDHAEKYLKLLKEKNKNHKYLELDGADHFSNTLSFYHQKDLYTGIIDYLKNDCGPDGL